MYYKETLADKINYLDGKIKVNQAHYDLEREKAKIFALSSDELKKYKYLTSKDLGYKPGVDIEYSALGKIFNKVLEENSKKKME